jgi:integrase
LGKLKNWRHQYPKGRKEGVQFIAPNTVVKWSRTLQAAFERANRNAGKKCVRGVVDSAKLLESNPWKQFTWIDGTPPHKRRFTSEELTSLLDHFETNFPGVVAATLFAQATLWLWARRSEVASLRWDSLRVVNGQYHFDFIGKRAVRKWARIPVGLYRELSKIKTDNPYVFAAYSSQLRNHHAEKRTGFAGNVSQQYDPTVFADWFHSKLVRWSKTAPNGHATQHAFRKTGLQLAYQGGVADSLIASDASITDSVMHGNYVDDTDQELLLKSNRTFERIVASLPLKVAERYGYDPEKEGAGLTDLLKAAVDRHDWKAVEELMAKIRNGGGQ